MPIIGEIGNITKKSEKTYVRKVPKECREQEDA